MAEVFEIDLSAPDERLAGAVCTIGVFDGVHRGHMLIIDDALRDARARGARCIVMTFDRDPDEMFAGGGFKKLMSNEQRICALAGTGADAVAVLPFGRTLADSSPDGFLDAVLSGALPAALHVGSDFRFGCGATGTVADLAGWGEEQGVAVHAHDLLRIGGERVSSTRIRGLLAFGEVAQAAELLGHPYACAGIVEHGREAGREMGIRTANLTVPEELRALGDGVYAAYAIVGGERYRAAVSVGIPPTYDDVATANMEAHILSFDGDLYGEPISLEFAAHLRPMQRFERTADLIAAIESDIAWVKGNL